MYTFDYAANCSVIVNSTGKAMRGFLHSYWGYTAQVFVRLGAGNNGPVKWTAMSFLTADILPDPTCTKIANIPPTNANLNSPINKNCLVPIAKVQWRRGI